MARALLAFLDTDRRPLRSGIIDTLSDPALTGISRDELCNLTVRLEVWQAAQAERLCACRK